MNHAIRESVRLFSREFAPTGPIVEIGSYYYPGQQALGDLRCFFSGLEYIGCDIRQGPGVDRIEDAHRLSFADASVGTMLILETLEHVPAPHRAVAEARRVLRDDGLLVVSVPFSYRIHGFPTDYWRFTASGLHVLFADFADSVIFALGPRLKPRFIFAVAAKSHSVAFSARKDVFRQHVEASFRQRRLDGCRSVFKERARDFFGFLLGRADLSAVFFDPSEGGGYVEMAARNLPSRSSPE